MGEAADGAEAVAPVGELHPDVVLMDLSMPGVDGIAATAQISGVPLGPGRRADHLRRPDHVTGAIDAGAVGFLLKDADPAAIAGAIRAAHRGEAPLDPRAALSLIDRRRVRRRLPQSSGAAAPPS